MEKLFLGFHRQETLPGTGEVLFMTGRLSGYRYRVRVDRFVGQKNLPDG